MVVEGQAVTQTFIPKLISLHQKGLFPFDKLVKKYQFAGINTAFAARKSGDALKPVVVF
jgi:aryl-alcohol dehydrogenase